VLQTAVSDLEVVSTEENGSLWHIRYPLEQTDASIQNKTEALIVPPPAQNHAGDVAVASPRGFALPTSNRTPCALATVRADNSIIADNYVDPEFGTGCVKITPAHDFTITRWDNGIIWFQ